MNDPQTRDLIEFFLAYPEPRIRQQIVKLRRMSVENAGAMDMLADTLGLWERLAAVRNIRVEYMGTPPAELDDESKALWSERQSLYDALSDDLLRARYYEYGIQLKEAPSPMAQDSFANTMHVYFQLLRDRGIEP